jgi:hypothetical protein
MVRGRNGKIRDALGRDGSGVMSGIEDPGPGWLRGRFMDGRVLGRAPCGRVTCLVCGEERAGSIPADAGQPATQIIITKSLILSDHG